MIFSKAESDIFFTTPSIPLKFGGLTTALFRRAHVFSKKFDKNINILTFRYQSNLEAINDSLRQKGYTNDRILVKNMYNFFSEWNIERHGKKSKESKKKLPNDELSDIESDYDEIKITKNGENIIKRIESIRDGKVKQIREFNNCGVLLRIRNFRRGNLCEELFFREDQSKYMVKKFTGSQGSDIKEILLLSNNEDVVRKFKSHKGLQMFWLELLININKTTYFINDGRGMDDLILSFNKKPIKKIFVIHSTHLRAPYNTFSTVRTGNRHLFDNIGQADAIVFLTNKQKEDITSRYGERSNFSVIPHFIENDNKNKDVKKSPNRFIVISRFHQEKQIDHIINAFNIVNNDNLDFQLDIYGDGKERDSLNSLINELSLEDKVKLHPFTNNPGLEFSKSVGSFLTSKYEGFGLTILESLKSNCPVFAYDIKYGPSDMLNNGYNGYLIEPNNIRDLAESIKTFILLPHVDKTNMFMNASNSIMNFSEEVFAQKWERVLENASYNSNYRYEVAKKEYVNNKVSDIHLGKKHLHITIISKSRNSNYTSLKRDSKGMTVEINKVQWEMKEGKRNSEHTMNYEISIPLKELKEGTKFSANYAINYYFNLDNIIYYNELKFELNKADNSRNSQSFNFNVFRLVTNSNNTLKLGRKKVTGWRSLLNYIRYR